MIWATSALMLAAILDSDRGGAADTSNGMHGNKAAIRMQQWRWSIFVTPFETATVECWQRKATDQTSHTSSGASVRKRGERRIDPA
jgi:hypothetical protein